MKDYKININQRVIEVIKNLQNDYTLAEIALNLGIKSPKLSEIMASRMAAGLDVISGLCTSFSVSPDYLLLGIGGMMRGGAVSSQEDKNTIERLNRIVDTQNNYIATLEADLQREREKVVSLSERIKTELISQ